MTFSIAFLARYDVLEPLGQGGMGQVLKARRRADGLAVALKVIAGRAFSDEDARQRFLAEARITSRLAHPAIVQVLEHGADGDNLYLVLELVSGGDLAALTRRGPLPPAAFFRVARPVLEAIATAHAAGVLHRDIKAANILLDADGAPRVADFGIAKDLAGGGVKTATGVIMGTPAYMAPELVLGHTASPASDQYALGVLLFEMLAGARPFDAPDPLSLLKAHAEAPVPPFTNLRKDVPPALDAAIRRALEKDPARRFPDVAAMAGEVARIASAAGEDWSRFRRTGKVPAPARRVTGKSAEAPTAIAAVPARGGPPVLALAAGAVAVVTLVAGGLAWRATRPASVAPPPPSELKVRVDRTLTGARVWWEPPLVAARARFTCASGSASGVQTASLAVDPVAPGGDLEAQLELELPGAAPFRTKVELADVSPPAVAAALRALRFGVVAGAAAGGSPERAIYAAFTRAMAPHGTFAERHPEDPRQMIARATRAAGASGLARALAAYRERRVEDTLRLASRVLGSMLGNRDAFRILDEIYAIAELYCFAELHGVLEGANEPMRMLYALPPGPLQTKHGGMLDGATDYARGNWRLRLIDVPLAKSAEPVAGIDEFFEKGVPPSGWLHATYFRKYSLVDLIRQAAEGKDLEYIMKLQGSGRPSNRGLAMEFVEHMRGGTIDFVRFTGVSGFTVPVPFELLAPWKPPPEMPLQATFAMGVACSVRVHVDLTLTTKGEHPQHEGTLWFRLPPRYRGPYAEGKKDPVRTILAWDLPSRALHAQEGLRTEIAVHAAPCEMELKEADPDHGPWMAQIDWMLLRLDPLGR